MRTLIVLLAVLTAAGCDSGPASGDQDYAGILRTSEGAIVTSIELAFEMPEVGGTTTGTYLLGRPVEGQPERGTLRAVGETDGSVVIGLAPTASDSGIDLAGTLDGDRLSGTWSVLTITGPRPGGTFLVDRQ